ncbi:MAG: P-loop NTPase [Candidatus Aminicenantes bacterium]|nr:P-loop NTPase [Candidatus Aminicenantes bacterium]
MIISIASGKGGTGKTTVAVSLASSLGQNRELSFFDCDVEEPNASFFLKPNITTSIPVLSPVPEINESKCTFCGQCAEICEYNALAVLKDQVMVFPELCHGCGGCQLLCPEGAIQEKGRRIGVIEHGDTNSIRFTQGILDVGQVLSPPLIREVKTTLKPESLNIIDAPPGTSCPTIESVKGSDYCVLVTEPTPFGLNDLEISVNVLKQLKIPYGVVLNRAGIGNDDVIHFCEKENIDILMEIPMDKNIAKAYSRGEVISETFPEFQDRFIRMFERIHNTSTS